MMWPRALLLRLATLSESIRDFNSWGRRCRSAFRIDLKETPQPYRSEVTSTLSSAQLVAQRPHPETAILPPDMFAGFWPSPKPMTCSAAKGLS